MNNGIFRNRKVTFAQVSNEALRDPNLSLKAKGLYGLIQSYITLEGFVLYKNYLMSLCKEGDRAFGSAWKELKNTGYLKQFRIPSKENGFTYEYELLDQADTTTPSLTNLTIDGLVSSTNQKEIIESENHNAQTKKCTIYKTYPMQNVVDINNNQNNNTEITNTKSNISSSINNINILNNPRVDEEEINIVDNLKSKLSTTGLNISIENIKDLINIYGDTKTIKAIQKTMAIHLSKPINKAYNYILAVLSDMEHPKVTNINVAAKQSTFNNFEPRSYDYDSLERQLLGW